MGDRQSQKYIWCSFLVDRTSVPTRQNRNRKNRSLIQIKLSSTKRSGPLWHKWRKLIDRLVPKWSYFLFWFMNQINLTVEHLFRSKSMVLLPLIVANIVLIMFIYWTSVFIRRGLKYKKRQGPQENNWKWLHAYLRT